MPPSGFIREASHREQFEAEVLHAWLLRASQSMQEIWWLSEVKEPWRSQPQPSHFAPEEIIPEILPLGTRLSQKDLPRIFPYCHSRHLNIIALVSSRYGFKSLLSP